MIASVDLENTGKRGGDAVVQLYVGPRRTRPVKELKGFERVTLNPGERRRVQFTLGQKELGSYDRDMRFVVEPSIFKVIVGTSSEGGLESSLEVVEE